jgi:hypothetical protein
MFLFDIPTKNKTTETVIITAGTMYKIIGAEFNTKLATSKQPKLGNNITKDKMMNRELLFFIGQI